MPTTIGDINLIHTKTTIPPHVAAIARQLRTIGIFSLTSVIVAGLFFGVGSYILSLNIKRMTLQKDAYAQQIQSLSRIESLFLVIKKQAGVASKVLLTIRPWEQVIDMIHTIVPDGSIVSFSASDKQEISLLINASEINEAIGIIDRITLLGKNKKLFSPMLNSLELDKNGKVHLSLKFIPTL